MFLSILKTLLLILKTYSQPNSQVIRKDPDSRKDWRQEEKGMTVDEMVWRHHRLNGHEFE